MFGFTFKVKVLILKCLWARKVSVPFWETEPRAIKGQGGGERGEVEGGQQQEVGQQ